MPLLDISCIITDFIENLCNFNEIAQKAAPLHELTRKNTHFKWKSTHQQCFEELLQSFKKDTLLRYFDTKKKIFVVTDANATCLGAMLLKGDDFESAKQVAIASKTTSNAEHQYPQLDLEATGIDFVLWRFQNYLVGAPEVIMVTDHKPLCPIFNLYRIESIRTDRIKLRHQYINYSAEYECGKKIQSDYLSRHGKPFCNLTEEEQNEADELHIRYNTTHRLPRYIIDS